MSVDASPEPPDWVELAAIVSQWVKWHCRRRAVRWALRGLGIGLGTALFMCLGLTLLRLIVARELVWGAAACGFAGLSLGGLAGLFWPVDRMRLARDFDRSFGLFERVSTAMQLHAADPVDAQSAGWRVRQLADALVSARTVNPSQLRPFRLERLAISAAACALLAIGALGYFGSGWFQAAEQARQVARAIQQERADLTALADKIQASPDITQAEKQALTEPLHQAIETLKEARAPEQALAALQLAGDQIRAVGEAANQSKAQALQAAGKTLERSGSAALADVGRALEAGDPAKAGSLLSGIDPNQLTAEQRDSLAQALAQAGVDPAQSGSLANGSLNQAGQAMAQAGQPGAGARAAQHAAGQIQQGQAAISQTGSQGQLVSSPGGTGQAGGGQGNTQAGHPGNGNGSAGNSQGQGQSGNGSSQVSNPGAGGGGAGRGSSSGSSGQGGQAGQGQISQGNGPGDGGETQYEPVYMPESLGGSNGTTVDLPGSGQPGSQVTGEQPSAAGNPGESQVPYVDALPNYSDAYRQAMENGDLPGYLMPVVRQYFSSLQP